MFIKEGYLNAITSEHRQQYKFIKMCDDTLQYNADINEILNDIDKQISLEEGKGSQLDIIGEIVGANRKLDFEIAEGVSILNDSDYLFLIKSKIAQNSWDGTIDGLYKAWSGMFPQIALTVYDNQDMSCTMLIVGSMSALQMSLLLNDLLLPKPAGVEYNYTFVTRTLFAYNLDNEQYSGYNKGYWEGKFKLFAFDMETDIFGGWDEGAWT